MQLMQYFVGYLIEGDASEYYKKITSELEQKFNIKNLSNFTPPHFTFRIPFETQTIEEFETYLTQLTKNIEPINLTIDEFGKFERKRMTIFLSATSSDLNKLEGVIDSLEKYDNTNKTPRRPLVLHASIARFLSPEQCKEIWEYVQTTPKPQFNLKFNNLTIFKLVDNTWKIHKIFHF